VQKRTAAVIGAGPAGLMAAEEMAKAGLLVTVYDRMPSPARKFLMAGRGGLNLTHSEPLDQFLPRYGAAAARLLPIIEAFPPERLREWSAELGEPTFAGSSGRVFPKNFKASPLLRAWLRRLEAQGVRLKTRCKLKGFDAEGAIIMDEHGVRVPERADVCVLAMGGASWPRLGSNGGWADMLRQQGVDVHPFKPANCGFDVYWSTHFSERFAGSPLKPLRLSFERESVRGEAMVTRHGLEGGGVYALSAKLRDAIEAHGAATLQLDLRPDVDVDALALKLARSRDKQSMSSFLRKSAGLAPVAIALLREVSPELPAEPEALAALIKAVPLQLSATRPIERAISSAGGIALDELDEGLMLKKMPGVFACGEMLDWEAPTGGYLLQASMATGFVAGRAAASRV
jgi:uncharacterized flavoprotein (TIGR03862 family)